MKLVEELRETTAKNKDALRDLIESASEKEFEEVVHRMRENAIKGRDNFFYVPYCSGSILAGTLARLRAAGLRIDKTRDDEKCLEYCIWWSEE